MATTDATATTPPAASSPSDEQLCVVGKVREALRFRTAIVWQNVLAFVVLHSVGFIGGFICLFHMKFLTALWTLLLVFGGGMGTTMGAHRLWSHRAYRASTGMRIVLIALQTLAGQNCLWVWARDHRQHHKYSDSDADPHNANRGFFFSHIGWLMMRKHPDVISKGKGIDMSDLEADPIVVFQKRWYKTLYILLALMVPVGVPILLWNEDPLVAFITCYFGRYAMLLNITWLVNSWAHAFGTRPYDTRQLATDSRFVGVTAMGEGWHNYHHCFPWDYRAAEEVHPFDATTHLVEWAARRGWATGLRRAPTAMVERRARATGDGSWRPPRVPVPHHEDAPKRIEGDIAALASALASAVASIDDEADATSTDVSGERQPLRRRG